MNKIITLTLIVALLATEGHAQAPVKVGALPEASAPMNDHDYMVGTHDSAGFNRTYKYPFGLMRTYMAGQNIANAGLVCSGTFTEDWNENQLRFNNVGTFYMNADEMTVTSSYNDSMLYLAPARSVFSAGNIVNGLSKVAGSAGYLAMNAYLKKSNGTNINEVKITSSADTLAGTADYKIATTSHSHFPWAHLTIHDNSAANDVYIQLGDEDNGNIFRVDNYNGWLYTNAAFVDARSGAVHNSFWPGARAMYDSLGHAAIYYQHSGAPIIGDVDNNGNGHKATFSDAANTATIDFPFVKLPGISRDSVDAPYYLTWEPAGGSVKYGPRPVKYNQRSVSASITTLGSYAVADSGQYRIGGYVQVNTVSSDTVRLRVSWVNENSVLQTSYYSTYINSSGPALISPVDIYAQKGSTITISTTLSTHGSMNYDVSASVMKL